MASDRYRNGGENKTKWSITYVRYKGNSRNQGNGNETLLAIREQIALTSLRIRFSLDFHLAIFLYFLISLYTMYNSLAL